MATEKDGERQIVHTIRGLHPRLGGIARSVTKLTVALGQFDEYQVALLSQGLKGESTVAIAQSNLELRVGLTDSGTAIAFGYPLKEILGDQIKKQRPLLLHDHGIWLPSNHYVAAAARKYCIPLVIHPRGMLEPWALQYRYWKKRLALRLYQQRNLETATMFFATADQEAENIRRLGLKQPIAVIPNGVEVVAIQERQRSLLSAANSDRIVLFLGRIHPIKGLLNLIEAWGRMRLVGWRLRLAGPDEVGHLAELMRKVQSLGLEASVEYVGSVDDDAKKVLFEEAELFVLPSFSENFGLVVAEALAHGLPVIATRGAPWDGLIRHGCGWWIDPTVDALSETMRQATSMDQATLSAMGEKGCIYAQEFEWGAIAQKTIEVYRWILGQGAKPDCVVTR